MGDYWEIANGLDTTDAEDRNNLTIEGYSNLEVYLNSIVGEFIDSFSYPEPTYVIIPDTSKTTNLIDSYQEITNISVYPNPVSSRLNVSFNLRKTGEVEFNILDISGGTLYVEKKYLDNKPNLTHFDITNLASGVYFLNIKNDKFTEIYRFIKK